MIDLTTIIGTFVRNTIVAAGGGFVASGVVTASQLDVVGGAAAILVGLGWSYVQKYLAAKKLANASR